MDCGRTMDCGNWGSGWKEASPPSDQAFHSWTASKGSSWIDGWAITELATPRTQLSDADVVQSKKCYLPPPSAGPLKDGSNRGDPLAKVNKSVFPNQPPTWNRESTHGSREQELSMNCRPTVGGWQNVPPLKQSGCATRIARACSGLYLGLDSDEKVIP